MPAPLGSCQQDFTACPVDWRQKGTLCYADASYSGCRVVRHARVHFLIERGPCNPVFDPSDMGDEQKFAYARQCKVDFPCQVRAWFSYLCEPGLTIGRMCSGFQISVPKVSHDIYSALAT